MEVPQARTGPPGQERRGPRKTGLRTVPRFAPGRPCPDPLAIPRRGGLRTPTMTALGSRRIFPITAPASRARIRWKWNASARVRPCNADAQSASLRENRPSRRPLVCPRKALSRSLGHPAEGRAPHARKEDPKRSSCTPIKPAAPRLTPGGNESPCYASGLATRAHRVRPSEKTALRVMPVFSPLGHPSLDSPPGRGGLCTPVSETSLLPGDRPIRPPGVPLLPMIMLCLGIGEALQRGRTECVPPKKPLSRHLAAFPARPSQLR